MTSAAIELVNRSVVVKQSLQFFSKSRVFFSYLRKNQRLLCTNEPAIKMRFDRFSRIGEGVSDTRPEL